MSLFDWIAEWTHKWREKQQTPNFGLLLREHTKDYLYNGQISSLTKLHQDTKDALTQNLAEMVSRIQMAENPILENRKTIASLVYSLAAYTVLALTEDEKPQMEDYANVPWISGELHHHLPTLAKHFDQLDKERSENEIADEDLHGFCNQKAAILIFYVNGLNLLRVAYNDAGGQKDWFRPFLVAMMIWWEYILRSNAGLDDLGLGIEGIVYSTFTNLVVAGADNPLDEFDRSWKKLMSETDKPDQSHYLPM